MILRNHLVGESCTPKEEGNETTIYPQVGHGTFRGRSEKDELLTFRFVVS